jgi:hypothetical protein
MNKRSPGIGGDIRRVTEATGIAALVGKCFSCGRREKRYDQLWPRATKEKTEVILPTHETPLPTGPEQYEFTYVGSTSLQPKGVVKNLILVLKRFRANLDGTNPVETVPTVQVPLYGAAAVQQQNVDVKAAVAKYNAANEAAIQQLIKDLGA